MKNHIELSPRLRMVADLVPQGCRLADVGTDHAYLPAALIQEGKIPSAIAADLRQGPLDRAKHTVRDCGLNGKVAFRLCDGLKGIRPDETDAVAVAGDGRDHRRHPVRRPLDPGTGRAPGAPAYVLHVRPAGVAGGERLYHRDRAAGTGG